MITLSAEEKRAMCSALAAELPKIRELLGAGTFGAGVFGAEGIRILPEGVPAMQMVMPVGGFLTLGFLVAGFQWFTRYLHSRQAKKKEDSK